MLLHLLLVAVPEQTGGEPLVPVGQQAGQSERGLTDESMLGEISDADALQVVVHLDHHLSKAVLKVSWLSSRLESLWKVFAKQLRARLAYHVALKNRTTMLEVAYILA